jgi:aspartate/methionine/tyrosine aminotransferase
VGAGLVVAGAPAGLYLGARPATGDDDCWATVGRLADRGILVAPGSFYGAPRHVRVALTGTDERIAAAVERLAAVDAR